MKGLNQKGPRMAEKREVNGNITPRKNFPTSVLPAL